MGNFNSFLLRNSFIIIVCFNSVFLVGQKGFDPKILFLIPEKVQFSDNIDREIIFFEEEWLFKERDRLVKNSVVLENEINNNDTLANNYKAHYIKQLDFAKNFNFSNYIIKSYADEFQNKLSANFPELLVYVMPFKSTESLSFLGNLSKIENADYIILTPVFRVTKVNEELVVKPTFRLYSKEENRIISILNLDDEKFNKISYDINDSKFNILFDDVYASQIRNVIMQNGNSENRVITKYRHEYLLNLLNEGKVNHTIKGIIAFSGIDIDIKNFYTGLYNAETNQMLVFFVESFSESNEEKYKLSLLYFVKKSQAWKFSYIINDALLSSDISLDYLNERMFYNFEKIGFFKDNSSAVNEKFWSRELFIKYDLKF